VQTVASPFTLEHALNQHRKYPAATSINNLGDWALGDPQNFELFLGVRTWYDRAGAGAGSMATKVRYRDGDPLAKEGDNSISNNGAGRPPGQGPLEPRSATTG
jgi:hypothetical protein